MTASDAPALAGIHDLRMPRVRGPACDDDTTGAIGDIVNITVTS
jgi:hypothetical protein